MTPRLAICSIVLTAAWSVGFSGVPCRGGIARQQSSAVPSTAEMEADLLQALNAERAAGRLPAVRSSPELVALARKHSAEMARRNVFSHDSEAGLSYQQRLTEAGIASVASGENLSRSSTFLTRLIHQSLMDSPPHRENILNPAYDTVGIGVASRDDRTYFVTEDFIKSFARRSGAEIRTMTLGALNRARARAGLGPVVLVDAVNGIADQLAEAKADGRDVPEVPAIGKRTWTFFLTGLDLDQVLASVRDVEVEGFGHGGIGSAFSRSPEHPDGAYVICVLLVWGSA